MADEWFDVVNDANIVVGRELRSVVHRRGLKHRGIHVFLFTREGKLLIQRRTADRDMAPLALDCSVSEHVKAGEDYDHAAQRGLKEELSLAGIELRPIVQFQMRYGPTDDEISQLYEGSVDPALVRYDPGEIAEISYYTLDELMTQMSEGKDNFGRWFQQLLYWYFDQPSDLNVIKLNYPKRSVR